MKKDKIQVVNTLTGEVHDFAWSNPIQLRAAYTQLNAMMKTFDRAKAKLAESLNEFLGDNDRFDFGDGYELIRVSGMTKTYTVSSVRQYLDEDQLALVLKVDGKRLKDLMADLVKEGVAPDGAWKDIESQAETKPIKSYVKVQKL